MTSLKEELKTQADFASLEQEAYLSVLVTSNRLLRRHSDFMAGFGISPKQYNILRILRGAGKGGLPVMEIGRRMVEKSPDISRIIKRLTDMKLVERRRLRSDRRVAIVTVSKEGLKLLEKMEGPISDQVNRMLSGLSKEELSSLIALLDRARDSIYSKTPS